jgi:hypothetical protein
MDGFTSLALSDRRATVSGYRPRNKHFSRNLVRIPDRSIGSMHSMSERVERKSFSI